VRNDAYFKVSKEPRCLKGTFPFYKIRKLDSKKEKSFLEVLNSAFMLNQYFVAIRYFFCSILYLNLHMLKSYKHHKYQIKCNIQKAL
jgi:hypothetical protein